MVGRPWPEDYAWELHNEPLADALNKNKDEFSREEFREFGIKGLQPSDFIKSGDQYFKPYMFVNANLFALTKLPDELKTIGDNAFSGANLSALKALPVGLTTIGTGAFYQANLSALTALPDGLTTIGESAFKDANLSALQALPAGLTTIYASAFEGANLSALEALPA